MLASQVPVHWANAESGCQREIRQPELLHYPPDKGASLMTIGQAFSQEEMQHCSPCVKALQFILVAKHEEEIVAVVHRQMSRIGIVGPLRLTSGNDIGIPIPIRPCQTVSSSLCRGSLQIVKIPGFHLVRA